MAKAFTHLDGAGKLRMVDISTKRITQRQARAQCRVITTLNFADLERRVDELDPVHAARLAGVVAAKRTAELIPLCHTISLNDVNVEIEPDDHGVNVVATVNATQRTGVEMEALTACAVAALSLLSALGDADPSARVVDLVLLSKRGGKSGDWGRLVDPEGASRPQPSRRRSITSRFF